MFLRRFSQKLETIRQVTNITRSNLDKSLIDFLDININVRRKDKTGVLTCGQCRLVNNHSERRVTQTNKTNPLRYYYITFRTTFLL